MASQYKLIKNLQQQEQSRLSSKRETKLLFKIKKDMILMKRALSDTNFYGLLARDKERLQIIEKVKRDGKIIIYGLRTIRNELRDTPKLIKIENKSLRIDLLNLYDSITGEHVLEFTNKISKIAENYYKAYREFGGSKSKNDIINDFTIVSAASLNKLDIVISNDERSMLTENALKAYDLTNSIIGIRTPKFINYNDFKNLLRGDSNEFF